MGSPINPGRFRGFLAVDISALRLSVRATPSTIDPLDPTRSAALLNADASGGNPPYVYRWTPEANLDNWGVRSPLATPSASTTYVVEVIDTAGARLTGSVHVEVARPAIAVVAAARPDRIAPGATSRLQADVTGGVMPYSFEWTPAAGLDDPGSQIPGASPSQTTTYTVRVTDRLGSIAQASAIVTVSRVPAGCDPICPYLDTDAGTSHRPLALRVGDVDGDGLPDVVLLARSHDPLLNTHHVFVMPNVNRFGTLTFRWEQQLDATATGAMDVADVNGDGRADVIVAIDRAGVSGIAILLSNGDGTFQAPLVLDTGAGSVGEVLVARVNGDASQDIVFFSDSASSLSSTVAALLQDATGNFVQTSAGSILPRPVDRVSRSVVTLDVDGDSNLDVVASTGLDSSVVLYGDGTGRFVFDPLVNGLLVGAPLLTADVTGDDRPDLIGRAAVDRIGVVVGIAGGFGAVSRFPMDSGAAGRLALADLNGDGLLDLLVTDATETFPLAMLPGDGVGFGAALPLPQQFAFGQSPLDVAVTDLNGDGYDDVITSVSFGGTPILLSAVRPQ